MIVAPDDQVLCGTRGEVVVVVAWWCRGRRGGGGEWCGGVRGLGALGRLGGGEMGSSLWRLGCAWCGGFAQLSVVA